MIDLKKIIFILILFISCFYIYKFTRDDKLFYLNIGDGLAKGVSKYGITSYGYSDYLYRDLLEERLLNGYNNSFVNKNYRIIDVINIVKNNNAIKIDNKSVSINQLLKKADIITISIGMNELYYKLSYNSYQIYQYLDDMVMEMDTLLNLINKYDNKQIFIIGYYSINNEYDDYINYLNTKIKVLTDKYDYIFIDCNRFLDSRYYSGSSFYLNVQGYELIYKNILAKLNN